VDVLPGEGSLLCQLPRADASSTPSCLPWQVDLLVAHLAKIHRLRDIDFSALREAARGMAGLSVPVNTQVMCEGEQGDAFYVVLNGKLAVTQTLPGNNGHRYRLPSHSAPLLTLPPPH
jgi:hypothetical protein